MTDVITAFYAQYPYPGHSPMPRKKMEKFANQVLACSGNTTHTLAGKKILEAGCGTGEISCSMGTHAASVRGIDVSPPSIQWARRLAHRYALKNVEFDVQDLFSLPRNHSFDLVASLGVLHHTQNPKKGFEILADQVKPNGILLTGWYHSWGGWKQRAEKEVARMFGGKTTDEKIKFMQRFTAKQKNEHEKIFLADRIANPREKYYRVPKIASWYTQNGFDVMGIQGHKPKMKADDPKNPFSVLQFELELLLGAKRFFIIAGKKLE